MMHKRRANRGSLAAGPMKRGARKPRIAAKPLEETVDATVSNSARNASAVLGALAFLTTTLVVFALLSALLVGLTVLPAPSVAGRNWLVQRSAWPIGKAPVGSVVYAAAHPVERGFKSRWSLLASADPTASIVYVLGVPGDKVATDRSKRVIVNGAPSAFTSPSRLKPTALGEEYLTICVLGECGKPGALHAVQSDYVLGKVLGSLQGLGLTEPPAPAGAKARR